MKCPNCNSLYVRCPECGKKFKHGTASHCDNPDCIKVDAPLDCIKCDYVVEHNLKGVLNLNMKLIKY